MRMYTTSWCPDCWRAKRFLKSNRIAFEEISIEPTCISHHLTAEARDKTAMTSLRLLAVLDVLSSTPARAKRRAPRPDGPLTHFASPRGEKCRLNLEAAELVMNHNLGKRRVPTFEIDGAFYGNPPLSELARLVGVERRRSE